ncbi:type III secretion system chaperone [Desulfocurvus sp. DL9XJH121]
MEDALNDVLAELARELELNPAGILLQDGYTCLAVDRARIVHIRLVEDVNDVDVFMELGSVPAGCRQAVCEDMLQGNVLCQATGGGALGLDPERGVATLTMRLGVPGMDVAYFKARLEAFLTAALFWTERIGASGPAGESPGTDVIGDGFLRV